MIKKVKKGFTLIELVVVIAVIAILSAVSVVAYVGITNSAKKSAAQQEADQIAMTVRAAALTSAEGYTEKDNGSSAARYTVTWTSEGLTFERLGSATLKIEDVIKDMYKELEEKDLPESTTIKVAAEKETAFASDAKKASAVTSFEYKTESYDKGVEALFVR